MKIPNQKFVEVEEYFEEIWVSIVPFACIS